MRQSVENFGPICRADIEIKPLTVIIGKNCVGKSFFSNLFYAMLASLRSASDMERAFFSMTTPSKALQKLGVEILPDFSEQKLVSKILDILLEEYRHQLESLFKRHLESIFGVPTKDLIRVNSTKATIRFDFSSNYSIEVNLLRPNEISLTILLDKEKLSENMLIALRRTLRGAFERDVKKIITAKRVSSRWNPLFDMYFASIRLLLKELQFLDESTSVYIIPAGRAGLLEGYNTVQSALLSLSPIAPIQGVSMPPIPGPAAEFYRVFLQLKGRKGPMRKVAKEFEDLIKGRILVKYSSKVKGKASLSYLFESADKTGSTDVIHAASGIKELVVLQLIITEFVKKGDFLIIEEPESHLHPSAQSRLMEIISVLIQNNVRVVMTTHSDIVLKKLAQLTGIHNVSEGEAPYSLDPDKFAAYLFKDSKNGSTSEKLVLTNFGTFEAMPTFDDVIKELYDKETSLQSAIQMKG
jgi:predicted ATPase